MSLATSGPMDIVGSSKRRFPVFPPPAFPFPPFRTMRLAILCLASFVLAATPTAAVRVNLPTDQVAEVWIGQKLEVVVAGNPTTGYTWKVKDLPKGLTQLGEPTYVQDPAEGPGGQRRLGVGGRFIFTFVGSEPTGREPYPIQFVYVRPWEKDTPPAQTLTLQVRVLNGRGVTPSPR